MRQVTLLLVALFSSAALLAQTTPPPEIGPATMCYGTYALCIKAPCKPIVTRDATTGAYSITEANCTCEVLTGWSMGPGNCDSRQTQVVDNRYYMVSTYSNYYNRTNMTLTCPTQTTWAWCYGSPCVQEKGSDKTAICTCPVQLGIGLTLGGDCVKAACAGIWSAATPAASAFANNYYYDWMKSNGHEALPPAIDCPTHLDRPSMKKK